jgi:hypothetical protein
VLADVAVELGHVALAEAPHLVVAAALRVEVGATLGAPDGHAGERVLELLVEAEGSNDAEFTHGWKRRPSL